MMPPAAQTRRPTGFLLRRPDLSRHAPLPEGHAAFDPAGRRRDVAAPGVERVA